LALHVSRQLWKSTGKDMSDSKTNKLRTRCPVEACGKLVVRIDQHLKNKHKMDINSEDYLRYRRLASDSVVVLPEDMGETDSDVTDFGEGGSGDSDMLVEGGDDGLSDVEEEEVDDEEEEVDEEEEEEEEEEEDEEEDGIDSVISDRLKRFERWLVDTFSGGRKTEKEAKQITARVKKVGCFIQWKMSLAEINGSFDRIEMEFIPLMLDGQLTKKGVTASTVKTYLNDFLKFCKFGYFKDPEFTDAAIIEKVKMLLLHVAKPLNRQVRERAFQKREEDRKNIVSPEEIRSYMSSETAKKAEKILGKAKPTYDRDDFILCRNYLIVMLSLYNISRAGNILNLTLDEVKIGKKNVVESMHVLHIHKHKTAQHRGSAEFSVDRKLFKYLETFIKFFRNHVVQGETDVVFLTKDGIPVSHATLGSIFTKELGRDKGNRLSATLLRKSVFSASLQTQAAPIEDLAELMKHDRKYQATYDIRPVDQKMARTSALVMKSLRQPSDQPQRKKTKR